MNIAICDDEQSFVTSLSERLKRIPELSGADTETFTNPEMLYDRACVKAFDILFLDIDMPAISGLELASKLHELAPRSIIIFVTSHSRYALDAFDCEAFGYLMKDCSDEKLKHTVKRACDRERFENAVVSLKTSDGVSVVSLRDIYYIEYVSRNCLYHTAAGQIACKQTVKDALEELESHGFYQIHKYLIVNFAKVTSVSKKSLMLQNGEALDLSRYRFQEVLDSYIEYKKRTVI